MKEKIKKILFTVAAGLWVLSLFAFVFGWIWAYPLIRVISDNAIITLIIITIVIIVSAAILIAKNEDSYGGGISEIIQSMKARKSIDEKINERVQNKEKNKN